MKQITCCNALQTAIVADIMIVLLLYFHNKFQLNKEDMLINDDNKQE